MDPEGGTGHKKVAGTSQMVDKGGATGERASGPTQEQREVPGETGPDVHATQVHDAATGDAELAERLANADPEAEAMIRSNGVPFMTVKRKKNKKKDRMRPGAQPAQGHGDEATHRTTSSMRLQGNRKQQPATVQRPARQAGSSQGAGAGSKATELDKLLYQLRGFVREKSLDVTIMEQLKRIQQYETATGTPILTRTIAIDGDAADERTKLRHQLDNWILREALPIQVIKQRLRLIMLNFTTVRLQSATMNWRAALTGEGMVNEEGDGDVPMETAEAVNQLGGTAGGRRRALPAGVTPPLVPTQLEPRQLRTLTQLEQDDLRARMTGELEVRDPPRYLRASLSLAEYAAVLDGYDATVRGRMVADLLPNMRLDSAASYHSIMRQTQVGDDLRSLRDTAAAFREVVMGATYNDLTRTLHFKTIGRPSARTWNGVQIPFQGRVLTLRDVSHGATSKTTYGFTVQCADDRVAAVDVLHVFQQRLLQTVVDFDSCEPDETRDGKELGRRWRVTLQAPGCPSELRDVTRILLGGRALWIHHTEIHSSHPCHKCTMPTHIDKACVAPGTGVTRHTIQLDGRATVPPGQGLQLLAGEPVGDWLQRFRVEHRLSQHATEMGGPGRQTDVARLANGRGPLVTQRAAQLLAQGYIETHAAWAQHVATSQYQGHWDRYRLPTPQPEVCNLSQTDTIQRLWRAHCSASVTETGATAKHNEGRTGRSPESRLKPVDKAEGALQATYATPEAAQPPPPTVQGVSQRATESTAQGIETEQAEPARPTQQRATAQSDTTEARTRDPTLTPDQDVTMSPPTTTPTTRTVYGTRSKSKRPSVTVEPGGRKKGMKVVGQKATARTPSPLATRRKTPRRLAAVGRTDQGPAMDQQAKLVDLASPSLPTWKHAPRDTRGNPPTADPDHCMTGSTPDKSNCADRTTDDADAEHVAPEPMDDGQDEKVGEVARRELRTLRGAAPVYDHSEWTKEHDAHPSIKFILKELGARLSATPANGNCMGYALLESDINRPIKELARHERSLVESALRELKLAIFEAFDSNGEFEAANMHHDDATAWMEETGCTREEAHHRYFARFRDSSCRLNDTIPREAWGGIEALCMAAKATRCPIYMVMENPESGECSLFKIERFHESTPREIWRPLQLPYDAWRLHLAREATREYVWPPVIHHLHNHYSAILLPSTRTVTVQAKLHDFFRPADDDQTLAPSAPERSEATTSESRYQAARSRTNDNASRTEEIALATDDKSQASEAGVEVDLEMRTHEAVSITTSQEEELDDYHLRATPHHRLVERAYFREHGGTRTDELLAFLEPADLTPLTCSQQQQLDGRMREYTQDDYDRYAREQGDMSIAAARQELETKERRAICATTTAQDDRVRELDTNSDTTYSPSASSEDDYSSDASMASTGGDDAGRTEPTGTELTLRQLVIDYFGDAHGSTMKIHLNSEDVRDKLLANPQDWTVFYGVLPEALDKLDDLPLRFTTQWGRGMLAACRLRLVQATLGTLQPTPERTTLQRWCDCVTRELDPRRSQLLLRNSARHVLFLAALPKDVSDVAVYLFDERWAWAAGVMVITAALDSENPTAMGPQVTAGVLDCLLTLVSEAHWRHQVWELMKGRDTTALAVLARRMMQLGRAEPRPADGLMALWARPSRAAPRS